MIPMSLLLNSKTWTILPSAFWFKFEVDNLRNAWLDYVGGIMRLFLFDATIKIVSMPDGFQQLEVYDKDWVVKISATAPAMRVKYKILYYSSWVDAGKIAWYYWDDSSWVLIAKSTTDIGTTNRLAYGVIEPSNNHDSWQCTIYNTYIVNEDFSTENPTTWILFSHTFSWATIDESVWMKFVEWNGWIVTPLYPGLFLGREYWNCTFITQIWQITV